MNKDECFLKPFLKPISLKLKTQSVFTRKENGKRKDSSVENKKFTTLKKSRFSDGPVTSESVHYELPSEENTYEKKIERAKAHAQRIVERLRKEGKLKVPLPSLQSPGSSLLNQIYVFRQKETSGIYIAKIDINNLPLDLRNTLTSTDTINKIEKQFVAKISSKGSYTENFELKKLNPFRNQLHLEIQATNKNSVDGATEYIKNFIENYVTKKVVVPTAQPAQVTPIIPQLNCFSQPSLPTGNYFQDKVFINIEPVTGFDIKQEIQGVNFSNFKYLSSNGSKVFLRGHGSGFIEPTSGREAFEAMHVYISHPTQLVVNQTKQLVQDLLASVKQKALNFSESLNFCGTNTNKYVPLDVKAYVQKVPAPVPSISTGSCHSDQVINKPKRKFSEKATSSYTNVLGYTHTNVKKKKVFSETKDLNASSSKRKKFTEELPVKEDEFSKKVINNKQPFWMTNFED